MKWKCDTPNAIRMNYLFAREGGGVEAKRETKKFRRQKIVQQRVKNRNGQFTATGQDKSYPVASYVQMELHIIIRWIIG